MTDLPTPASPLEDVEQEAKTHPGIVILSKQKYVPLSGVLYLLSRAFEEGVREGLSQGFPKVAQDAASEVCGISTKVGYATSEDGSLRIPQFGICQSPRGRCLIHSPAREPEPHPPTTTDQ